MLVIFGAFFVTLFSAGAALDAIGSWSLLVWAAVAGVGLLQAYLLYRLARRFPFKAGGTATYAIELFRGRARILAFLSGWGYWIAWTPAVALGSYLCANLLGHITALALDPVLLALLIMALLYALNYFGLSRVVFSSALLALLVLVPLAVLAYLALQVVTPDAWLKVLAFGAMLPVLALLKWFFVIAWTGYAAEMISSVIAETREHHRYTGRMFAGAALGSVLALVGIPLLLLFRGRLIEMLAVANVGYLVVFVLLPLAYWVHLRQREGQVSASNRFLIAFLGSFNLLVLLAGGYAWGWFVFGVGWLLVLAGVPLFWLGRLGRTLGPEQG